MSLDEIVAPEVLDLESAGFRHGAPDLLLETRLSYGCTVEDELGSVFSTTRGSALGVHGDFMCAEKKPSKGRDQLQFSTIPCLI